MKHLCGVQWMSVPTVRLLGFCPVRPLRPSLRTGNTGEGGTVEEEMKGGRKRGLSHYQLGATHPVYSLFLHSFSSSNSNHRLHIER